MRILFGVVGVIMILVGGFALLGSSTVVGQIGGLIAWVIAAQLITSAAIIEALARLHPSKPAQ
jgi:hypothetical protein